MTRFVSLFAAALLVSGCTPLAWVKPGASPAEVDASLQACQLAAWREASWRSTWMYRPFGPSVVQDALGRRYFLWPYPYYTDPFGDRFFEESRLTQFCMRAKGYELIPVEPEGKGTAETIQPSPEGSSSGKP